VVVIVGLAYKLLLPVVTNNEACKPLLLYLNHAIDYRVYRSSTIHAGRATTMRDVATQCLV